MPVDIHGFCEKRFLPVREAFEANFKDGLELGASVAATLRGKPVVDLWAGWRNPARTQPWRRNTIVCVFSVSKIMLMMCAMKLVDRGLLDLDATIARYWPEFGQNGKDKVTIREFLTHRGGVPIFDPPVTWEALSDWQRIVSQLAAQPHRFGGENVLCYHPTTFGFVLGEVIRRVDGRWPSRFLQQEFTQKLAADFSFGLSRRWDAWRVATPEIDPPLPVEQIQREFPQIMVTEMGLRVHDENWSLIAHDNLTSWRRLSLLCPAWNGYANARSMARLCAILANGGRLRWRRFLSRKAVKEIGTEQASGADLYVGPIRWGLSVALDTAIWPAPAPGAFHWGGFGGAWAVVDPGSRITLGYAPNHLNERPDNPRILRLNQAIAAVIGNLGSK